MYGLDDQPTRLCDGRSRREWLRVGGLGVLGLGLGELLRANNSANLANAALPESSLVVRQTSIDG